MEKPLRANRCAQPREENIYPAVSQPYINHKPNEGKCSNETPRPRLTSRRSAVLWRRRLNGDGPLQPGRCVLLTRSELFCVHLLKSRLRTDTSPCYQAPFPASAQSLEGRYPYGPRTHPLTSSAAASARSGASAFGATASLHDFISQSITPDMTRSISFNKIQLHSLCLFNRGKSIFLGTTFQLHYVQNKSQ